jgi:hypothetical protein
MRRPGRWLAAAAVMTVALAGCATTEATIPAAAGQAGTTTFAPLADNRVPAAGAATLVFFFAVDCGPCLAAAADLAATQPNITAPVSYYAVDLANSSHPTVTRFFRDARNPTITVLTDATGLVTRWQVTALGTTLVFDATGRQVYRGVEPDNDAFTTALTKATTAQP